MTWRFLLEASRMLASSIDLETSFATLCRLVVPRLADWCSIELLLDGEIRPVAVEHIDPHRLSAVRDHRERYRARLDDAYGAGRVIKTGETRWHPEVEPACLRRALGSDPERLAEVLSFEVTSSLIVPLRIANAPPVGALSLAMSTSGRRIGPEDVSLAEELAHNAALAIENARVYAREVDQRKQAERAARQSAALQALTAAVSEAVSIAAVGEAITGHAQQLFDAMGTAIWLRNGDVIELLDARSFTEATTSLYRVVPLELRSPGTDSIRSGQLVLVEDQQGLRRDYPELLVPDPAIEGVVVLPLRVEGRTIGCLAITFPQPIQRAECDIGYMTVVAHHCAQAIARAQLYEQARRAEEDARAKHVALADSDRRKDEFLAMLAHELRNPLMPIRLVMEASRQQATMNLTKRQWEVLDRQSATLARLVDDLLDVARVTQGKIELRQETVSVETIIARSVDSTRDFVEERRHHLDIVLPPKPICVDGDPVRLEQVIVNLLVNAAKYTPPGGRLALQVTAAERSVYIIVSDNGIGLDEAERARIFDLFAQGERSPDRMQGGLGIGLTIVKNLVEIHGGTVHVESDGCGKGARFIVELPRSERDLSGTRRSSDRIAVAGARLKVLVVDDNRDAADALAEVVETLGHEVQQAHDGEAAVTAARRFRPDVALLDIGLPGRDGYQVAAGLKDESIVLIAVTGYGQLADRRQSTAAGFAHHMVKPIQIEALSEILTGIAISRA